ncbi:MAG: CemA family protein [Xenococcaceae cyanobacterium]
MVSVSRFLSNVNQWVKEIPKKALNTAYQSALAIKAIEERYFGGKMISPEVEGGQSVYEYYKTVLDRELAKINFNLTQLRIGNFLDLGKTSSPTIAPEQPEAVADLETLEKLRFIETVIGKYRRKQEQENIELALPPESLQPEPSSSIKIPETRKQEPSTVLDELQMSLDENRPLRGNKLSPEYEQRVIGQLRRLREQRKITIRILALLLLVPILVNVLTKNLIFEPLIDSLKVDRVRIEQIEISDEIEERLLAEYRKFRDSLEIKRIVNPNFDISNEEERLEEKTKELILEAGYETKAGLINILADLTGLLIFAGIVYFRRRDCRIAVSFLSYNFSGLNVITKVFIFILLTDMFVGFHSAEGWEVILNKTFEHFGLAENPNFNGLFIATIPVIMDSTFKLLIFNYFTRTSPASVAILEKMNQ